jgi:hypothetical protein
MFIKYKWSNNIRHPSVSRVKWYALYKVWNTQYIKHYMKLKRDLLAHLCTVSNKNRDSLTIRRREIIPCPETQKLINQQNMLRVLTKLSSYRQQKLFQVEQRQAKTNTSVNVCQLCSHTTRPTAKWEQFGLREKAGWFTTWIFTWIIF